MFLGLILINALSIPLATPQIVLNLLLSAFYLGAGVLNSSMGGGDLAPSEPSYLPAQTKSERLAALKFSADDIINLESFAAKLKNPADPAGVSQFVVNNLSPATRGLLSNYHGGVDPGLQKALEQDLRHLVQDGLEPFASRLKEPAGPEAVSQFLGERLSPATRGLLSNYNGGADPPLQKALAEDLTRIVQGGQIYNARRFTNVPLSPSPPTCSRTSPAPRTRPGSIKRCCWTPSPRTSRGPTRPKPSSWKKTGPSRWRKPAPNPSSCA